MTRTQILGGRSAAPSARLEAIRVPSRLPRPACEPRSRAVTRRCRRYGRVPSGAVTLDELLDAGWADHDSATAAVSERLEANVALVIDADGAARFMHLANHAVGDHGGDRARALRLCRAAVVRAGAEPGTAALVQLAVACTMAGDAAGAGEAQRLVGEAEAIAVRVALLVAQSHMHAGRWDLAGPMYVDAIARAEALPPGHEAERAAAAVSNNLASELLERATRTPEQDAWMDRAAHAARTFWLRIGNWVNDERADYLRSMVHTALGRPAEGRACAERGLATIAANGNEPVDEAFLHVARARACRDLDEPGAHAASMISAQALAAEFDADLLRAFDGAARGARYTAK